MRREILSPFLSVAVACKGSRELIRKNLKALNEQSLESDLWTLILLVPEKARSKITPSLFPEGFKPPYEILTLPAGEPVYELRNKALRAAAPLLYLIDEDVILSPDHLKTVCRLHREFPEAAVIGGSYLDHPGCSFWGRAYNHAARLWGAAHPFYAPGGNLSVKTSSAVQSRFYSPHPKGFGGEEIYFFEGARKRGLQLLRKAELDAFHLARHSLRDLGRRALCHGFSMVFQKQELKGELSAGGLAAARLFFKEPGGIFVKAAAFCYLSAVYASFFCYKLAFRLKKL